MTNSLYLKLREKYKYFYYNGYSLNDSVDSINISFNFSIDNLTNFTPSINIPKKDFKFCNKIDSPISKKIVFYMGMIELISYWKSACCPIVIINSGYISEEEILWWKKLYFNGLGEFFYTNNISPDFNSFMHIVCKANANTSLTDTSSFICNTNFENFVPVGGGKDSIVTLELLSELKNKTLPLIINPRGASTSTALVAGYSQNDIFEVYRTIDKNLLDLNKQGFLNGHTPFSAMLGFVSVFCAYILGITNIILSNESSANESNIKDTSINHQYSKSFEFENDFIFYIKKYISPEIKYFSILRPLSELRIAKEFSRHNKYFSIFKSCNTGSKLDIWCGNCPKCLFVYIMLLPFLNLNEITNIFGKDLLNDLNMLDTFKGLIGVIAVKPFECVGTIEEVNYSLNLAYKRHYIDNPPPVLLDYYIHNYQSNKYINSTILTDFNDNHNIPEQLLDSMKKNLL